MRDAGRIGFVPMSEYNNEETYEMLDVVTYQNSSYVAKKETVGNPPAENNEFWQLIAKGVDPDAYYTREEVAALIAGIKTTEFKVVDALPTNDISTSTIYLVPKGNLADGNIYSEYIYVGDKWELIGDTAVDLDGYVTEEQIDTKLEDYAKKSEIAEGLQEITAEEALAILNKE